jgi:arginyl-tRNA synthetase
LYEKDGATWFRTTAFGDDKDRVLIKSDGEKAYFFSDIALRYFRFVQRGFDHEILFLGADHHGYIPRLQAAMSALGHAKKLDVEIVQLVRLMKDGTEVKMSKRAGTYVTLEEVVDEVGLDVARFFFLMHRPSTHMDFDMSLAKEKSEKNPVFYVQYAHARISSLLKKIGRTPIVKSKEPPHTSELNLVKALVQFPEVVADVARSRETQKLPFYAMALATKFHEFYTHCRVMDDGQVWAHRLELVRATQHVLRRVLQVMSITAPEKM